MERWVHTNSTILCALLITIFSPLANGQDFSGISENDLTFLKYDRSHYKVADINADGRMDLLAQIDESDYNLSSHDTEITIPNVVLYINDGAAFNLQIADFDYPNGELEHSWRNTLELYDADADGDLDLFYHIFRTEILVQFETRIGQGGAVTFHFVQEWDLSNFSDEELTDLVFADFTADGFTDMMTSIGLFENTGSIAQLTFEFISQEELFPEVNSSSDLIDLSFLNRTITGLRDRIHGVDMNQDGLLDIVAPGTGYFLNNGNNSFSHIGYPDLFSDVLPVDLNMDGRHDLVVIENELAYYYQTENGFERAIHEIDIYESQHRVHDIAIGDITGNGRPDLAYSLIYSANAYDSERLAYLLNYDDLGLDNRIILDDTQGGTADFIDFDGDSRLDLFNAGLERDTVISGSTYYYAGNDLFHNQMADSNHAPLAPVNLRAALNPELPNSIIIQFDVPENVDQNQAHTQFLTDYFLYDAEDDVTLKASGARAGGDRLTMDMNGFLSSGKIVLKDLMPDKTYRIGVQLIDYGFKASSFTTLDFTVEEASFYLMEETGGFGLSDATLSWADINNDNHDEIVLAGNNADGSSALKFIEITGDGSAEVEQPDITALDNANLIWLDLNLDSYPDFLMYGQNEAGTHELSAYLNNEGLFSKISIAGLDEELDAQTRFRLTDADQDGTVELVYLSTSHDAVIYDLVFTEDELTLITYEDHPLVSFLSDLRDMQAADLNMDGGLEWITLVERSGNLHLEILTDTEIPGGIQVVESVSLGMNPANSASTELQNMVGDDRPEMIIQGKSTFLEDKLVIYQLDADGAEPELVSVFEHISVGSQAYVARDFDSDGLRDLMLMTDDGAGETGVVFVKNETDEFGVHSFEEHMAGLDLISILSSPSVISVDVNDDGKPDLITSGFGTDADELNIYLSAFDSSNSAPNKPEMNEVDILSSNLVQLRWNNAGDMESGEDQLRYQLWLSEDSEELDRMISNAEPLGGKAFAPDYNGVFGETIILNLEPGKTYYASVVAVDAGELYSGLADPVEFTMPYDPFLTVDEVDFSVLNGSARMVDLNADGLLDVVYSGYGFTGPEAGVYLSRRSVDDELEFRLYEERAVMDGLGVSNIAIGDIDGDTKPDLIHSGVTASGLKKTVVLQNSSSPANILFYEAQELTGVTVGDAVLFDADRDGDMDVVLTGSADYGPILELYRNSDVRPGVLRENPFTLDPEGFPAGVGYDFASLDVADVNKDGWLDLLVSGNGYDRGLTTDLYLNHRGNFTLDTLASNDLPQNYHGEAVFADINFDGWTDIVVAGREGTHVALNQRAEDGQVRFETFDLGLPGIEWASLDAGDLNNDGAVDLLITGEIYEGDDAGQKQIFMLLNNDGEFDLAPDEWLTGFYSTSKGTVELGDIDNDGSMDILLASNTGGIGSSRLFKNQLHLAYPNEVNQNESPEKPVNPTLTLRNGEKYLTWNASEDDNLRTKGLRYNVRLSSEESRDDVIRSGADPNEGTARYRSLANAGQNLSITLPEIEENVTYYWAVQAIDASGKHSEWSEGAPLNDEAAQAAELVSLIENGPTESRINIVFLAEAWQEDERDDFIEEAREMAGAIFEIEPYRTYQSYFNSFALFVPSVDGEISYGIEGGDGSKIIENRDTYFNAFRNNYGNAYYVTIPDADGNSLEREGTGTTGEYKDGFGKVDNLLAEYMPQFDLVMMLCKSDRLAGSAVLWQDRTIGFVGIPPSDPAGLRFKIARHELAHSLGLGDEYDGDFNVRNHFQAHFPNTYQSELDVNAPLADFRNEAPWSNWLNDDSEVIREHQSYEGPASLSPGVFAGSQYSNDPSWKRAHKNDMMKDFRVNEFGPVNREWIVKAIYGYRWHIDGMPEPFHRLRPVTPIEEHTPAEGEYELAGEDTLTFEIQTMMPDHVIGMDVDWYVNDMRVGGDTTRFAITRDLLEVGINTVKVRAHDITPYSAGFAPHADYDNPDNRRWVIPANDTLGYLTEEVEWEVDLLPSVANENEIDVGQFKLSQNYPNPFNPATRITFELPEVADISLEVYDILGRKVQELAEGRFSAGEHTVTFNAINLANGVYFYTLSTSKQRITRKMTLLK